MQRTCETDIKNEKLENEPQEIKDVFEKLKRWLGQKINIHTNR